MNAVSIVGLVKSGERDIMFRSIDRLNELCVFEMLTGVALSTRTTIHASQSRLLALPISERTVIVANVLLAK